MGTRLWCWRQRYPLKASKALSNGTYLTSSISSASVASRAHCSYPSWLFTVINLPAKAPFLKPLRKSSSRGIIISVYDLSQKLSYVVQQVTSLRSKLFQMLNDPRQNETISKLSKNSSRISKSFLP